MYKKSFHSCFLQGNQPSTSSSLDKSKVAPLWIQKLPNRLTYLRILCIPIVVYLLIIQEVTLESKSYAFQAVLSPPTLFDVIAAVIFSIAALTDFFDGWIARKFNVVTLFGKLLDPLADKLLVVSVLVILVEKHRLLGWVAVILIVRDLGINAIRISAIEEGIQIPSSIVGKTKTALLDIGIVGLIVDGMFWGISFNIIGQIFIFLALIASTFSAIEYLRDYTKALKNKVSNL
ncbi:MAG: CDP-diacylglycerol--glycerol-3-phosphate 3-phosphatidyltransferase [Silvanigrellaceae bacterium]|nr:CDP-diacylglycerol--glycerol-3-phosphate 3-phosphatidyltransferase [Silvanigrellaceae bacterium]